MIILLMACAPQTSEPVDPPDVNDTAGPVGFILEDGEAAIAPGWIGTGQPDEVRIQALVEFGYLDFTLREEHEDPFDEQAVVLEQGGDFMRVGTTKDLLYDPEWREELYLTYDGLLERDELVYLHCRTGDRVGATWALYLVEHTCYPPEQAIALGREAGLLALERTVLDILGFDLEDIEYDDWEQ